MKKSAVNAAVVLALCVGCFAYAENGLVLHYTFEEGKGDVLRDRSGNNLHGKIHGAKWVKTPFVSALEFDGRDDFVECPYSPASDTSGAFTVEAWVFPRRHEGGIFCRVSGGGWQDQRIVLTSFYPNRERPCYMFCIADGKKHDRARQPALALNAWTHLAAVFDGTAVALYRNGVHERSFVSRCKADVKGVPVWIGRSQGLGDRAYFRGRIAEVRYYKRALAGGEVKRHYEEGGGDKRSIAAVRRDATAQAPAADRPARKVKKRLVGCWDFDEGSGAMVRDSSGRNHHGKLAGATFVRRGKGYALRFDGEAGFVEVGADPDLNIGSAGTVMLWFKPEELQGALFSWGAATEPGNRRFVAVFDTRTGWGAPGKVLRLWMGGGRKYEGYSQPLSDPRRGDWNHIALVTDGRQVTCFYDGAPDMVISLPLVPHIRDLPFVIGKYVWSGKQVFKGLIDEVRLYNYPLRRDEVLACYRKRAASFGKDATLFTRPRIGTEVLPDPGRVVVRAHCALMGPLPKGAVIRAALFRAGTAEPLASQERQIARSGREMILNLDAAALVPGRYQIRTVVMDAQGKPFGKPSTTSVNWPGQSDTFKNVKVLNNLVWELLNEGPGDIDGGKEYRFTQPKLRWVYVACMAQTDARPAASIRGPDGTQRTLVFHEVSAGKHEAMAPLAAGEYTLALRAQGKERVDRLIVRSVPDIVFAVLIPNPYIKSAIPLDEELIRKHVAPHVNTFVVSQSNRRPRLKEPVFKELRKRGIRFVMHCSVPRELEGKPVTAQQAYDYLAKTRGMSLSELAGSMADEFGVSRPHCAVYADAWRRLHADAKSANRVYFPYVGRLYTGPEGRELIKVLGETGSAFAFKRYLRIRHTEQASYDYAYRFIVGDGRKYRDLCPGSMESMIVCFGYLSAPNEFLNVVPQANYKTYLDMQFNMVANMPEYWGTRGLMNYLVNYADEETTRWIARLFRHYGIEGKTERASNDPFDDSRLLANGDFAADARHWKLSPAEPGSIRRSDEIHFGWLQGRFQYTPQGDSALLMVRSARKPNTISQQIRNLEPGRLYAFRMITGEHNDMTRKEEHAVSIRLKGAQVFPEKSFAHVFHNCYSHSYGQYDTDNHAWMNYHWVLFRATGPTATLTVSDWANPEEPGGLIGQPLMFNFLQVHPYFESPEQ